MYLTIYNIVTNIDAWQVYMCRFHCQFSSKSSLQGPNLVLSLYSNYCCTSSKLIGNQAILLSSSFVLIFNFLVLDSENICHNIGNSHYIHVCSWSVSLFIRVTVLSLLLSKGLCIWSPSGTEKFMNTYPHEVIKSIFTKTRPPVALDPSTHASPLHCWRVLPAVW